MVLPGFEYHEPLEIQEACEIMADLKEKVSPLAGGTDLLVNMKKGDHSPPHVLSLGRIDALRGIKKVKGHLSIGATARAGEISQSPAVNHDFRAVGQGSGSLGSPLIRNLATIGGNLVSARPAADFPPCLMVHDATVVLAKAGKERSMNMADFFKGPGKTAKAPDEILLKILLTYPPPYSGSGYVKLGKRRALEISVVNVAAFISLEGPGGAIREARIALGAVAPVPIRAVKAENALKGERPGESAFARAGETAAGECRPIDDFRGSARYRTAMVAELTKRALALAFEEAKARELRRWK